MTLKCLMKGKQYLQWVITSSNVRDSLLRLSASLLGKSAASCPGLLKGIFLLPLLVSIISLGSLVFCSCPSLTDKLQQNLAQFLAGLTWLSQIKRSYGVLHLDHVYQHSVKLKFIGKKCFSGALFLPIEIDYPYYIESIRCILFYSSFISFLVTF